MVITKFSTKMAPGEMLVVVVIGVVVSVQFMAFFTTSVAIVVKNEFKTNKKEKMLYPCQESNWELLTHISALQIDTRSFCFTLDTN